MKYLYLDTSSNYLFSSIVEDDKLLVERKIKLDKDLSTLALKEIVDMFNEINIEAKDINKIILVNGPGSFTGCRIGITIAKTYAWSLNIPISIVSSLEAMAISVEGYDFKVPVIDARRDYIFSGIYDSNNNSILKDQYVKKSVVETVVKNMTDNYIYITNDEIELDGDKVEYNPDMLKIVSVFKDRESINPHAIDANYLKLTEAEEKLNDSRS